MQSTLPEVTAALLKDTGLSQRALADLGGFNEAQIGRWLSGKTQRPEYQTVWNLGSAIMREYPDLGALVAQLFTAAGYPGAEATIRDERPELVRKNWHDRNVRKLWALPVSVPQRVGLVRYLLAGEDDVRNPAVP
jgi:transcriptional regulator with XRE-family HTH domain